MAEKPPPSPSWASPGSVKEKIQQLDQSDINEGNIMTITPDKLTPDQKEFEAMMQQARNQLLNSFMQTRKGTMVQKYQAAGPVYLPGGTFPNYRPLITDIHPPVQAVPPIASSTQPMAPVSISSPAPPAPSTPAPGQLVNPRLLMRKQPQHSGQVANRLTQDQVAAMFLPPQSAVDPVQQQLIQQTPPIQQVVQPIQQQVVQPVQETPPRQQIVQPIQQTPSRQQTIQPIHQQGLMNPSAGRHTLNQVVPEHLVHHVQPDHTVVPQIAPEHLVRNIQPNYQSYQGAI
ncbi:uncharacterized protein LOC127754630 [Oryza glaberrima]|uniref:uncharacterized protein LOC127754630 n=1 Tax=Oryza glaberrima TaxID=4538 RepID=UPI00224C4C7F|nr:uncharacterized protein LOC127754630 [Oryza glaberrima]